MSGDPGAAAWIETLAQWAGRRAAELGRSYLLSRLAAASTRLVAQARSAAAERTRDLRRAAPMRPVVQGRAAEGIVVAWLIFTLGTTAGEIPAALACLLQWVRVPLGLGPPACAAGTADGLGIAWLAGGVLAAGLFYVVGRWALAVADDITDSKARMVEEHEWRARVLILGLSTASPLPAEAQIAQAVENAPDWEAFCGPQRADGPAAGNWQQGARVIRYHLSKVEAVYVLPSAESAKQVDAFCRYCRALFPREVPIREIKSPTGADFAIDGRDGPVRDYENYDYVYEGLKRGVEMALDEVPGLIEGDICVDVTPGQKIFSIAAGVITLNRGLRFCYVTTGREVGRSGRVFVYDAQLSGFGSLATAARAGG